MSSFGYKSSTMTRSDAEFLMDTEVRSRDFWAVFNDYDNCIKLQKIIDILYNSEEGNDYEVDYQENQNGTRLTIRCNVCSKELTSYDPFVTHENGKLHKKTRQQKLTPKDPNLGTKLQKRPHNEVRGIFPKGSLEEMVDSCNDPVLGIQFVYKEVIHSKEKFTCQLCQKSSDVTRIKTSRMFEHLTSLSHNRKYMEIKFGHTKDLLLHFKDEARQIEEREGKIHQPIIDFTHQLPPDLRADLGGYTHSPNQSSSQSRRHRSRSRSHSRRSRSLSRDRDSRSHSRSRCSRSPSRSRRSRSRSTSSTSRSSSISPEESRTSTGHASRVHSKDRKAESPFDKADAVPEQIPLPPPPPPPLPQKPQTAEAEVEVDMHEDPRPILDEIKLLHQSDCKDMLLEDTDMQACMIQTLWTLNLKLDKYYNRSGTTYRLHEDKEVILMSDVTNKLKDYIKQLILIPPESH